MSEGEGFSLPLRQHHAAPVCAVAASVVWADFGLAWPVCTNVLKKFMKLGPGRIGLVSRLFSICSCRNFHRKVRYFLSKVSATFRRKVHRKMHESTSFVTWIRLISDGSCACFRWILDQDLTGARRCFTPQNAQPTLRVCFYSFWGQIQGF